MNIAARQQSRVSSIRTIRTAATENPPASKESHWSRRTNHAVGAVPVQVQAEAGLTATEDPPHGACLPDPETWASQRWPLPTTHHTTRIALRMHWTTSQ